MRKYYVFLIVSAMALLTGCGSQKGLSGKSPEPNNNTQKPTVVTIPTSKTTALLKTPAPTALRHTPFLMWTARS